MFAGPVSNATTSSARSVGSSVRLAIPPRFRRARDVPSAKSRWSAKGTSGAPSPPAAMSALRKSSMIGTPVASATRAASPICSVARSAG